MAAPVEYATSRNGNNFPPAWGPPPDEVESRPVKASKPDARKGGRGR